MRTSNTPNRYGGRIFSAVTKNLHKRDVQVKPRTGQTRWRRTDLPTSSLNSQYAASMSSGSAQIPMDQSLPST